MTARTSLLRPMDSRPCAIAQQTPVSILPDDIAPGLARGRFPNAMPRNMLVRCVGIARQRIEQRR